MDGNRNHGDGETGTYETSRYVDAAWRHRRHRALGLWAASRMGFRGEGGDYYAEEVAREGDRARGDAAVVNKVVGDLALRRIPADEQEIWRELRRLDPCAEPRPSAA